MKNKNCGICREIETIYFCNKSHSNSNRGLTEVLKAQLVSKVFDKKGQSRGFVGYKTRELNFCPECGKKIEENKKKWRI